MYINRSCITLLWFFVSFSFATANTNLQVLSKDCTYYVPTISTPSIVVRNIDNTEAVTSFYFYYYFVVENNKIPQLVNCKTHASSIALETIGNGLYRVKFTYDGIILGPGQTMPASGGETFLLRYSDGSLFDKTNDPSNNRQTEFFANNSIPVYNADGTLLTGDDAIPPANAAPQADAKTGVLGNYALYSSEKTELRPNTCILSGAVGSGGVVDIGSGNEISGDCVGGSAITVHCGAEIKGDIFSRGSICNMNKTTISGERIENCVLVLPAITAQDVNLGTTNLIVPANGSFKLTPGAYSDFQALAHSTVTLAPGTYYFKKCVIGADVNMLLETELNGKSINIYVKEMLRIGGKFSLKQNSTNSLPYSCSMYTSQNTPVIIGPNADMSCLLSAPNAKINIGPHAKINGSIFGKQICIEPGGEISKPVVLADLYHHEWAMSPGFDPLIFKYTAVVPDATYSIRVVPVVPAGQTVTVNGNPPTAEPYTLPSEETSFFFFASKSGSTTGTEYLLTIKKDAQHQIFVNDDSPCMPGLEDGNSWSTAYKSLQSAIEKAAQEGKEIWLAEGLYKPTKRINPATPRSTSFALQAGTEIIGGFKGWETERVPQGSLNNTVLSGDLLGNDMETDFASIPFTNNAIMNQADNTYHVISVMGVIAGAVGPRLQNLTVTGGAANGPGLNGYGGAIYSENLCPIVNNCAFVRNFATKDGGALFTPSGIKELQKVLFKENVSQNGRGCALFFRNTAGLFNQNIFLENKSASSSLYGQGGAVYAQNTSFSFINSLFCNNRSAGSGSAIYVKNGKLTLTNCTITGNSSALSLGCITSKQSIVSLANNIHWHNGIEVEGENISAEYSLVEGGFAGIGNINSDPLFLSPDFLAGQDSLWGTADDGLRLTCNSPAIDASGNNFPEKDIADVYRSPSVPSGKDDLGAYTFIPPSTSIYNANAAFGYFNNKNEFIEEPIIRAFSRFETSWGYLLAKKSNRVLYARLLAEDRDETRAIKEGPVTLSAESDAGKIVFSKMIRIQKAANGTKINSKLVFYSKYPIMFLQDSAAVTYLNSARSSSDSLYFVFGNASVVKKFTLTAYTDDYR